MKSNMLHLRSVVFLFAFFFGSFGVSWGQSMWVVHLTFGRPIALTGGDRYVGDQVNQGSTYYYQFELNQASWNGSEVGIGKNTDGTTGWSWASATWYQDGSWPNKRVQRDIGSFQFTSSGTYYVVGRAKTNSADPWVYSDESGWNNNQTLTLSTAAGNASYISVSDLNPPTLNSISAVATTSTKGSMTLEWTKFASKNVMIVQSASNSFTSPTDGSNYSVGNNIGSGSVVYVGSGTSITISNLDIGTTYYFALYTENYTYYSTAVTTSKTVPSTTGDGNWSSTATWGSNSVPTLASSIFIGHAITQDQTLGESNNLSILSGASLTVDASKQLTVNGTLTNNGTLTIESGATFKQGSAISGNGTFNVKQAITGGNNGTAPNGRFWYMGVPMSGLTKGTAFGTVSGPTETKVWGFTETAANGWGSNLSSSIGLQETKGYAIRTGESNPTFTFSGDNLFSSDTTISLSYTNGFGNGFHLMCNSYMAPISWEAIYGASNNINATYWVRSYNGSSLTLDFDTYNAASNQSVNPSTLLTNEYIAPLQSFWVRSLPNTINQSITLAKSMTEHQTANVLKSSIDFPVFARVNLVDDNKFDQTLIYMDQNMSTAIDAYDSEKMFVSGKVQIYTKVGNNKLVMNGLRNNKKKITVPLYLEVPTSKIYELHLSEFNMEEGLILLEDKQEGVIQDFTINEAYIFYSNSGSITNRFVLHFYMPDASVTAQGPSNFWAGESVTYTESGSVLINSNARGYIQITIDSELQDEINGTYTIVDANGGLVTTAKLDGSQTDFELTIPSGIYYLTVNCGSVQEIKKVFIQN